MYGRKFQNTAVYNNNTRDPHQGKSKKKIKEKQLEEPPKTKKKKKKKIKKNQEETKRLYICNNICVRLRLKSTNRSLPLS